MSLVCLCSWAAVSFLPLRTTPLQEPTFAVSDQHSGTPCTALRDLSEQVRTVIVPTVGTWTSGIGVDILDVWVWVLDAGVRTVYVWV